MRLAATILLACVVASVSYAAPPYYWFRATGDVEIASDVAMTEEDKPPLSFTYRKRDVSRTKVPGYYVFVTEAQYNAGWAALDQGVKDAAKDAADDEASDFTVQMDKLLKAFALVVLDEINLLRAEAGLPARTGAQLRAAVRNKYRGL